MYEIQNGRPYYYPLMTLMYLYNIPKGFEGSYLKGFLVKFAVLMLFRFLVSCVMPMLHFIMSLKDKTGVNVIEDLSICIGEFGPISSTILFTLQYKRWSDFFTEVTDVTKFHPSINFEKFVRNSNRFSILYLCYVFSGLMIYGLVGLGESSNCKKLNEENGLHESCFVYQPVWFPFDTNDIFSTVTIFIVQMFVTGNLLAAGAMIIFIVLESTEILILHINVLKENFIGLFEETSPQEIHAKLRFCIEYHNHILRLGKSFNNLQKYTIGHRSLTAAILFGCILNQIQSTKPIGAVLYLLGCVSAIAIVCYSGQRLTDQSSSISDAVYASNWFKADPQTMKDLALVILRCKTPLYLNCIPLGTYDYALFVTILKTSYSYLTLLDGTT